MRSFEVTDIRNFMNGLLAGSLFDEWQFRGAELSVECKISFAPLCEKNYLEEHEGDYLLWPEIREKFHALIRGRKTPAYFRLVLALAPDFVGSADVSNVDAFILNVQYEKGTLLLVTAVSDKSFSLDKEPSRLWDQLLPELLAKKGLELRELDD